MIISILFLSISTFSIAISSIGDQSPQFRECISSCAKLHFCPQKLANFEWWSREKCFSCRQKCIWSTVDKFNKLSRPIPQFNGKWPFVPIKIHFWNIFIPIQEPASMIFSLLNAFTVWQMMQRIRREIPPEWYCRNIWIQFGWVGMATWFASTIFHCCDHWATEMLDYCSAFGLILFTLYASVCFVLPQWNLAGIGSQFGHFNPQNLRLIVFGLLFFYFRYLYSMYTAAYFDYSFHIRCCIQIALITAILFLFWTFFECKAGRARQSMISLGAAFGIGWFSAIFDAFFDFPPLFWLFDAHSLFHLFSIPVPLFWTEFLCQEAKIMDNKEQKE